VFNLNNSLIDFAHRFLEGPLFTEKIVVDLSLILMAGHFETSPLSRFKTMFLGSFYHIKFCLCSFLLFCLCYYIQFLVASYRLNPVIIIINLLLLSTFEEVNALNKQLRDCLA